MNLLLCKKTHNRTGLYKHADLYIHIHVISAAAHSQSHIHIRIHAYMHRRLWETTKRTMHSSATHRVQSNTHARTHARTYTQAAIWSSRKNLKQQHISYCDSYIHTYKYTTKILKQQHNLHRDSYIHTYIHTYKNTPNT